MCLRWTLNQFKNIVWNCFFCCSWLFNCCLKMTLIILSINRAKHYFNDIHAGSYLVCHLYVRRKNLQSLKNHKILSLTVTWFFFQLNSSLKLLLLKNKFQNINNSNGKIYIIISSFPGNWNEGDSCLFHFSHFLFLLVKGLFDWADIMGKGKKMY